MTARLRPAEEGSGNDSEGLGDLPQMQKKLFPIGRDTVIRNLTYMCKQCKELFQVNTESQEP